MKTRGDLRKKIYEEFKEIFDATNELLRTSQDLMAEMNQKGALRLKSQNHEKAAAILFSEAYGRFLGVKLLCEDGMGDTSLIVLRSLLNLFIMFNWILRKQKEARAKRYIGWYWKTRRDKIELAPLDYDVNLKRKVRQNYKRLRHLYSYKRKDKTTGKLKRVQAKVWYEPRTIERLANEAGLKTHYEDGYRILSWVEHVDPTHVLLKARSGRIIYDPCFDIPILNESLVMNFFYFRNICATIDDMFSLGKGKLLKDLADRQKSFRRA